MSRSGVSVLYEKLNEAIKFATDCHAGQLRKMANTPYILHPMEVAAIISTMTSDENVIIAGMLHDTVEDCNVDPLLIRERFGSRVFALVQSETEDKLSDRPPAETWMERKEESLLMLHYTRDRDVKILWLADKLSNIRSFHRAHLQMGDAVWKGLNQKNPKMHEWYYRTIAQNLSELSDTAAYAEYIALVDQVFGRNSNEHDKIEA